MTSESALWKALRDRMGEYGKFVRIEDKLAEGTPDIVYTMSGRSASQGVAGWIELKYSSKVWSANASLKIGLRWEQANWLWNWSRAGGNAWVFARIGDEYWLWPGSVARELVEPVSRVAALALCRWIWHEQMDWAGLARILREG